MRAHFYTAAQKTIITLAADNMASGFTCHGQAVSFIQASKNKNNKAGKNPANGATGVCVCVSAMAGAREDNHRPERKNNERRTETFRHIWQRQRQQQKTRRALGA
ncbi:MAG: hypothetical protein Q8K65_00885 [Alphaproteobacteria bacterium]|nr:hypothetical protein [Alphaproteobacteria bacterium]